MTMDAQRNYIEPMFRFVALVVVVLLCGFTAGTLQRIRSGQLAFSNGFSHSCQSFCVVWMILPMFFCSFACKHFISFALLIQFVCVFTLLTFAIAINRTAICCFTFFRLMVFALNFTYCFFAFFCLAILIVIFEMATFAVIFVTTFGTRTFVKFGNRLGFLADSAGFRYDLLSHNRLLTRRLRGTPLRSAHFIVARLGGL